MLIIHNLKIHTIRFMMDHLRMNNRLFYTLNIKYIFTYIVQSFRSNTHSIWFDVIIEIKLSKELKKYG